MFHENRLLTDDSHETGYRRLYLCDRFFEQKMADVVGCTSPEGEICEVNTYFVYSIQQIECEFRFQYRIFL